MEPSNSSVANINRFYAQGESHNDPQTGEKRLLVIDTVNGEKVVIYRALKKGSFRDLCLRVERFFGFGDASFNQVAKFATQQGLFDSLNANARSLLLKKITEYNRDHNWSRAALRVNVKAVIENLNQGSNYTEETIIDALKNKDKERALFLIENSPTLFAFHASSRTEFKSLFEYAAGLGNVEIVEKLYPHFPSTGIFQGPTPPQVFAGFILAMQRQNKEVIQHMLDREPSIIGYAHSTEGNNALAEAILSGDKEILKLVLESRHLRNPQDLCGPKNHEGKTAIHIAILEGKIDMLRQILRKDVTLNDPDINGDTPLHLACQLGKEDAIRFLLEEARVKPNLTNKNGERPLDLLKGRPTVDKFMRDHDCRKTGESI